MRLRSLAISVQIAISMVALVAVVGLGLTLASNQRSSTILEDELIRRSRTLGKSLASAVAFDVAMGETRSVQRAALMAANEEDVSYVIVHAADGNVVAHSADRTAIGKKLSDAISAAALDAVAPPFHDRALPIRDAAFEVIIVIDPALLSDLGAPQGKSRLGVVRVGVTRANLRAKLRDNTTINLLVVLFGWAIAAVVSVYLANRIVEPLNKLATAATRVAAGDFSHEIEEDSTPEIGRLARAFNQMTMAIRGTLVGIRKLSEDVDSTVKSIRVGSAEVLDGARVQAAATDRTFSSVAELSRTYTDIAASVQAALQGVDFASQQSRGMTDFSSNVAQDAGMVASRVDETASAISEMSASIHEVSRIVESLANAAEQTKMAIVQISASVRDVERTAKESSALSDRVTSDADILGMSAVQKTIAGMQRIEQTVNVAADTVQKLGARSEQIGEVLTVINGVTDQVNLLALNAAILSASAGEHGKGFAVVADEIKSLASRTAISTREISDIIANLQRDSREAVTSMHTGLSSVAEGMRLALDAQSALTSILDSSKRSTAMSKRIEKATVQQSLGIKMISDAMDQVGSMVDRIVRATQEQSHGSDSITAAAETMRQVTGQVRTSVESVARASTEISNAMSELFNQVQRISLSLEQQRRGGEVIRQSVADVRASSQKAVGAIENVTESVRRLNDGSERLRSDIERFDA